MEDPNIEDVIQNCPKCLSSNSTRKDLKFKVSYCGHSICEKCFALMNERTEDECATCHAKLVKNKFRPRKYDNDVVESYLSYYNDVKRIYNCDRIDFDSLAEYNDYLEEVEFLIMDLMSQDKEKSAAARTKMNDYHSANKVSIKMRRNRKNPDFEEYERIEREQEKRRLDADIHLKKAKRERQAADDEYNERLVNGNEPVDALLKEYAMRIQKDIPMSAGLGDVSPQKVMKEATQYQYERPSYMQRDSFSYQRDAESSLVYDILMQTLPEHHLSLRAGGGYSTQFWFHRLRHFCE